VNIWRGPNYLLRADLHVHTCYSKDCTTRLDQIIVDCLKKEINCLAIADHGTTEGARKLKEIAPFPVIIAEEILTPKGEIMGMFLSENIPNRITVADAIKNIRSQGGLVCIPHPGDNIRSSAFNIEDLKQIIDQVDIIEIFNSRNCFASTNNRAKNIAQQYEKLGSAGSDAHILQEIGNACIEMPEFSSKDEFLKSLSQGNIIGHLANPFVHVLSTRNKFIKKFSAKRVRSFYNG
jgi:predicted metal-dependent phosphoesterase TrpH